MSDFTIAVIRHERCGEPTSYRTLVWVPAEWSRSQFETAVIAAQKDYVEFAEAFKNEPSPVSRPSHFPDYASYPEKTVAEVQVLHTEQKAIYKEWEDERRHAQRGFEWYLRQHGLKAFWDHEPPFTDEVSWGHRHGLRLDYSATEDSDFPGPLEAPDDF